MDRTAIYSALLERLWDTYKERVPYAKTYNKLVLAKGGKMTNDHMAFRTLNVNMGQPTGIEALARVFRAFGYYKAGEYTFKTQHLFAHHYLNDINPLWPKIFISQLEVSELPQDSAGMITNSVKDSPDRLSKPDLACLKRLEANEELGDDEAQLLIDSLVSFFGRPWSPPSREVVNQVNDTSQYGAWTLLHGNSVNHFTAYVNEQDVTEWKGDIELTLDALREAGVPLKDEIEGERGTKLRQSSTQAVVEPCDVTEEDGSIGKIDWTYAYYEILERNTITNEQGEQELFTGFLGEQATNLFKMTEKKQQ